MEKRLFTTASNRAQRSVHATPRENYKTLVGQIGVLDPKKIDHKNPRFVEDEVKSLWHPSSQQATNSSCVH